MIFRFPFVLFAAAGVVSILGRTINLHPIVAEIAKNFRELTHPLWDRSLGLVLSIFELELTSTDKDDLTVGAILLTLPLTVLVAEHPWPPHETSYSGEASAPSKVFGMHPVKHAVWELLVRQACFQFQGSSSSMRFAG